MVNLKSSVSNLQRLFTTASSQRGPRQHESIIEESHTYDLLYPEGQSLSQGQHHTYPLHHGDPVLIAAAASNPDDRGGLDLQSSRDVRIVIAQDANTRSPQPRILYDSKPSIPLYQGRNGSSPEASPHGRQRADSLTGGLTGGGGRRNNSVRKSNTAPHSRHSSLSQTTQSLLTSPTSPLSPVNELGGLFGAGRGRGTSARPATSDGESAQGRLARESREETEALLECMFGSATGLPSTSSTKLHVRPPKSLENSNENRQTSAGRDSSSSTTFPKKRTPLTRSTTAADLQSLSVGPVQQTSRDGSYAIWITRLFSVDPKDPSFVPQHSSQSTSASHQSTNVNGALVQHNTTGSDKKEKAKQLKTPTYAIAILLQMPVRKLRPLTPSHRSFNSFGDSPQSWSFDGYFSVNLSELDSSGDIDYVISHWSVIDRALSSLEVVARCIISDALGHVETSNSSPAANTIADGLASGSTMKLKKPKQSTQQILQLDVGALQNVKVVQDIADSTGKRVALALKIRKVVAGQGRWPIWREEARWVDKWAGGREHGFFFFTLLTAFVGSHTEWLESLAPVKYKRRHSKFTKGTQKESNLIQHRTVIVSQDKMAARRLIFLLSAFLPGTCSNLILDGQRRIDASWSSNAYSQSPPSGMPILRQQSLRRKVHQTPREDFSSNKAPSHGRSISFSEVDYIPNNDVTVESQSSQQHSRRPSDARSIRSSALLIASDGSATRKSSTTTTATIKPGSAWPVPQFAGPSTDFSMENATGQRPSSSDGLAPLSLQRTLSRSESNEHGNTISDSQPRSTWGSVFSSFLSTRHGSSTGESDLLGSSGEGLGISGVLSGSHNQRSAITLNQMVKEVEHLNKQHASQHNTNRTSEPLVATNSRLQLPDSVGSASDRASPAKDIPQRHVPDPFPLKLSIDENDGVIDVDLPPPRSFASSFASTASSPLALNTAASSYNDRSSFYLRSPKPAAQQHKREPIGDVAGWLRNYHQDFALQAVRPYDSLKEDIKRSMRTEPTPTTPFASQSAADVSTAEGWTDVCTTLIADTATFTVSRLTLRRKDAHSSHHRANALLESSNRDTSHEEEIVDEKIMDLDPIFIDAVEKVLSHSGDSSRVASRTASRAPSPSRRRNNHTPTEGSPGLEIPKSECRRLVLGALEQVARSVGNEMGGAGKDRVGRSGKRQVEGVMDSTLREGVRSWFREVDGVAGV